jgi:hypothetical protein
MVVVGPLAVEYSLGLCCWNNNHCSIFVHYEL